MKKIRITIFLLTSLTYLIPYPSQARDSIFEQRENNTPEEAQKINNPLATKMIYGRLEAPGEIDFYTFTFPKDVTMPVEIFVPFKEKYRDFKPSLIIIGKNFIQSGNSLPFTVPAGNGVVILSSNQEISSQTFNDKLTLTSYARRAMAEIDFLNNQPYYLAVISQEEGQGPYVIKIGEEEIWGAREVLNTGRAFIWVKLGQGYLVKSIGIVIGIVLGVFVIVKLRRPKKTKEEKIEEEI